MGVLHLPSLREVCVMHTVLRTRLSARDAKYVRWWNSQKCLYKRYGARGGLRESRRKISIMEHCVEKHGKDWQEFKMSVTGVYGNDAMLRQVAESVRINRVGKGSLINTKKEWNYVKLPRVVLDQGEMWDTLCEALHEVYELTKTLDTSCPGY